MSREPCPYQDARPFQYAFVAGLLHVEYLEEVLPHRRPDLQGVAPCVIINVTTREGCEDRATTECGMHHYPMLVWRYPHTDVLRNPVVPKPFCVFGSASSCLLEEPGDGVDTVHVRDVADLTPSFRQSALSALESLRQAAGTENKGYKRKLKHVMTILRTSTNTADWTSTKRKSMAEVVPSMAAIPALLPLRPGPHHKGLSDLVPKLQGQVALKAAVEAVHTSSLVYGGVVVLGDDSGKKKTTQLLIDHSRFPRDAFSHKHRIVAVASRARYEAWQDKNSPSCSFASVASFRLIVGQGMDGVTVKPPLDDLVDADGTGLNPAKNHHAVMMLLGDVHDHVHIFAALGRASSTLIPKLIGARIDDPNDITAWLGDADERVSLLTGSCERLGVRLYENQRRHILDIANSLVFFNPIASGPIPSITVLILCSICSPSPGPFDVFAYRFRSPEVLR